MKFNLTQEFIDKGVRTRPDCCPVALTIQAGGVPSARVGTETVFEAVTYKKSAKMPGYLRQWISDFDSFLPVSPIEFELDLTA